MEKGLVVLMEKSQTTIEYLVVFAAIVVVGLVVTAFVTLVIQPADNNSNSSTKANSKTAVGGISIVDAEANKQGSGLVPPQKNWGKLITVNKSG